MKISSGQCPLPPKSNRPEAGGSFNHYESLKREIGSVDHKTYERLAKQAARRAGI